MRQHIDNFLTTEECNFFISKTTEGMEKASITTPSGAKIRSDYRNNDRYIFDDIDLANKLFERLKPCLDDNDQDWKLKGLNERFKIYRYEPGQNFAMHNDAQFCRENGERSFQTVIMYLNERYEGGETEFFGMDTICPQEGRAIIFMHHLLHEGMPVKLGVKYVLRTDIMY